MGKCPGIKWQNITNILSEYVELFLIIWLIKFVCAMAKAHASTLSCVAILLLGMFGRTFFLMWIFQQQNGMQCVNAARSIHLHITRVCFCFFPLYSFSPTFSIGKLSCVWPSVRQLVCMYLDDSCLFGNFTQCVPLRFFYFASIFCFDYLLLFWCCWSEAQNALHTNKCTYCERVTNVGNLFNAVSYDNTASRHFIGVEMNISCMQFA